MKCSVEVRGKRLRGSHSHISSRCEHRQFSEVQCCSHINCAESAYSYDYCQGTTSCMTTLTDPFLTRVKCSLLSCKQNHSQAKQPTASNLQLTRIYNLKVHFTYLNIKYFLKFRYEVKLNSSLCKELHFAMNSKLHYYKCFDKLLAPKG